MGMQLIGAWFSDQTVLNAALAFQDGTDWHTRRPAITA
jgi:Asp-tRNA(Asn)/Glu-tRNA(Gln) amidotransferase A subunit family amidase